jgi:hypothetical protein
VNGSDTHVTLVTTAAAAAAAAAAAEKTLTLTWQATNTCHHHLQPTHVESGGSAEQPAAENEIRRRDEQTTNNVCIYMYVYIYIYVCIYIYIYNKRTHLLTSAAECTVPAAKWSCSFFSNHSPDARASWSAALANAAAAYWWQIPSARDHAKCTKSHTSATKTSTATRFKTAQNCSKSSTPAPALTKHEISASICPWTWPPAARIL